uniref:Uncharacterized protein n=1 Tax=Anguilla anguilla TaxID=7936 RepID=A0A0E9U2Y8_ANGAN
MMLCLFRLFVFFSCTLRNVVIALITDELL